MRWGSQAIAWNWGGCHFQGVGILSNGLPDFVVSGGGKGGKQWRGILGSGEDRKRINFHGSGSGIGTCAEGCGLIKTENRWRTKTIQKSGDQAVLAGWWDW